MTDLLSPAEAQRPAFSGGGGGKGKGKGGGSVATTHAQARARHAQKALSDAALPIREDPTHGVFVDGLQQARAKNDETSTSPVTYYRYIYCGRALLAPEMLTV